MTRPRIGSVIVLGDALITAEVLVRPLTLIEKRGILTLGQALDAVRLARRVTM